MKTAYLTKGSYNKRLDFLKSRWEALMTEQDGLTHEAIASDAFQSKRKRIARLYNVVNNEMMRERKDAVRMALNSVSPNAFRNGAVRSNTSIGFNF